MLLSKARVGFKGSIKNITGNDNIKQFLFSLGCFEGEELTLISVLANTYVINVKDSRYALDKKMAEFIEII